MTGQSHPWTEAFEVLFTQCLQASRSDRLLIVFDESAEAFLPSMIAAHCRLGLPTALLNLPLAYQHHLVATSNKSERIELPAAYQAAVQASSAILTVLAGDLATSRVRGAVIGLTRPKGCRLAHIPGISEQLLSIIGDSPLTQILQWSDQIAWAVGEAQQAVITTFDRAGREFRLTLPLEGWDNEPLLSTGVISPDSWGNVPPAEVFCCPRAHCAHGKFVVNGSVQGHVFPPGEEVVLVFERGRLVDWSHSTSAAGTAFFDDEQAKAVAAGDTNWNVLAELGIGLNPAVRELTGNSLMDEKAAQTVHIAIGDNFHFGFPIKSSIHADLVAWRPVIEFDGHKVLERGAICSQAIADWQRASLQNCAPLSSGSISVRKSRAAIKDDALYRRVSRGQRSGEIRVADAAMGRSLAQAYRELATYAHEVDVRRFIAEHACFADMPSAKLLAVLKHLRIADHR